MQGNLPQSLKADIVYSDGNMMEENRRYNLKPLSPPSQPRPPFERYPIGSSTGFPPTIPVARAASPPLSQPFFFQQDLGSSTAIEISDGAGSPKPMNMPTPMMGQKCQVLAHATQYLIIGG